MSQVLREKDYEVCEVDMRWVPSNTVQVEDTELASSLIKMVDALEESDDVQTVTANFEMSDELIAATLV